MERYLRPYAELGRSGAAWLSPRPAVPATGSDRQYGIAWLSPRLRGPERPTPATPAESSVTVGETAILSTTRPVAEFGSLGHPSVENDRPNGPAAACRDERAKDCSVTLEVVLDGS